MLDKLLNTPKHPHRDLYSYLPVSTSLEQQLKKQAKELINTIPSNNSNSSKTANKNPKNFHQFIPNQSVQNIKQDLIMLKLKGYMDRKNISGKNQQLKKLPTQIQVGRMIEGDPFLSAKAKRRGGVREKGKQMSLTDYYLEMDAQQEFSTRKFSEIQRGKQRRKKITKKSLKKLNKRKNK